MKISSVETFLVDPGNDCVHGSVAKSFLFVCLQGPNGMYGWGEAFTLTGREQGIENMVLSLGQKVIEHGDIDPHKFRSHVTGPIRSDSDNLDYSSAISAIEIALWDLLGKAVSKPVHQLLGDEYTKNIPVYANTWVEAGIEMEKLVARCVNLVGQGYRAVKVYPLKYGNAQSCGQCVKAVREALGGEIDIMLDLSAIDNPPLAYECAREVAPYAPFWFEEPHTGEDLDTLAEIRRLTGLRVVTGEKHVGKKHFANVLRKNAADILNPDIVACGGVLEMLEIGAMAEAHAVTVSPHCWGSMTIALAAMLQACAVMPNAEYAEIFPDYFAFGDAFSQAEFTINNGMATLGNSPGLGINIDRTTLLDVSTVRTIS